MELDLNYEAFSQPTNWMSECLEVNIVHVLLQFFSSSTDIPDLDIYAVPTKTALIDYYPVS